jgi:tartrate-resistant acid phosphatase type 5
MHDSSRKGMSDSMSVRPAQPFVIDRRRALKTLFCSSAALALHVSTQKATAQAIEDTASGATHLLAIGDFGTTGEYQRKVAAAMQRYIADNKLVPDSLLLLGDNFYGPVKDGFTVESARWQTMIEEMYPEKAFPGKFHAILGNHDYHDNDSGEVVQLAYAKTGKSRFSMPAKWYRFEVGSEQPLATVIAIDTNLKEVSGRKPKDGQKSFGSLTKEEAKEQWAWLESELAKPRAPFTIVMGHHPLYSNGSHGDTKTLVKQLGPLLEKHKVHAYLCGHDHDLQHLELEDCFTSFVISGGGGARTRKLKSDRQVPFANDVYGFTHIQLEDSVMTISHHGIEQNRWHRFKKYPDGSMVVG